MAKRVISLSLVLCILFLGLMYKDVKAESVKVNNTSFSTLQEAVDSIDSKGTIVLIDDIYQDESVVIPAGKNITITDDGKPRSLTKSGFDNNNPIFIIEKGGTLNIEGTSDSNLILDCDQVVGLLKSISDTGNIIHNKGTLNLKSGTIMPGFFHDKAEFMGGIFVDTDAVFNMHGGIICDMKAQTWYISAVFVKSGATFNMYGGIIKNNINEYTDKLTGGGGVLLFVWSDKKLATMTMSGGSIQNNKAYNGGGVYMTGYSKFTMTGGVIENNHAIEGDGGGVCVAAISQTPIPDNAFFTLDGGIIKNNSARNGGGIYVNSDGVELKSGVIEGNKAIATSIYHWSGHGGGVYVSQIPRVLKISNTIVTENLAKGYKNKAISGMGGGLWACPTGSIEFKVTNGIAIFNNHATGDNSAGDDVVKVEWNGSVHNGHLTLPNRLLGGGKVDWYLDGGITQGIVGDVDTTVPRFNSANPGTPLNIKKQKSNYALKAVTSKDAIKRAYEEATLFIRKNEAAHGGGIGTNGDVTMPNYNYPDWTLKVRKKWDNVAHDSRSEVNIYLKINDIILDSIKLNKDNNWQGSFTELPDPLTLKGKTFDVIEGEAHQNSDGTVTIKETRKWIVSYQKLKSQNYTMEIDIKNKGIPLIPQTGDNLNIWVYIGLLSLACAGIVVILKKQNRQSFKF